MIEHLLQLGRSDLHQLAAALRSHRLSTPFNPVGLGRVGIHAGAQDIASELQALSDQGLSESQLASVLDLVVKDRDLRTERSTIIDLVATGPEAPGVVNRDTSVVVRELFANAQNSVLVAGYAVHQGQQVFRALADRMVQRPGLRVRMFLDVQRGPGDNSASQELVRRFAERFRIQQWPTDRHLPEVYYDPRSIEPDGGKRACLHAKCVVVDSEAVFVSSANFTEAAQERNIEIGLLVRSGRLAEQVLMHFNALAAAGQLKRVL
jgi:phosphatidylserine/phosphatidylglycerophosphate/cardiolipin synthase-like enzyme